MNSTKITTKTDLEISALLQNLSAHDAILTACHVLGKNPGDYGHLDNGRQKMCAGNLLRGAARKDEAIVAKVRDEVEHHTPVQRPTKGRKGPKAAEREAAKAKEAAIEWPKSRRFAFAQLQEDGEWKFSYSAPKQGQYVERPAA